MKSWLSQPRGVRLPTFAVTVSLVLGLLAAVAVIGINELGYHRSADAIEKVGLYDRTRLGLHGLLQSLLDAETGERGYLLTGRQAALAPYRQASGLIEQQLATTHALFLQTSLPTARFNELADAIRRRLAEMAAAIASRSDGRTVAAQDPALDAAAGDEPLAEIRQRIAALIEQNSREIEQRREDIVHSLQVARIGIALTSIVALLAFYQTLRQARALAAANQQRKEELERERDRLDRLVKSRTARLAELATHLQNVREDERAHLARELHDELGSLLTAAKLDVARLKSKLPTNSPELQQRLKHLTETLNSGIALKRRIIEALRPSSLVNLGLTASLGILTREFSEQSEIEVQTQIEDVALDDAAQLTVYRLVQESLTNIGKYSAARSVRVSVRDRPDGVEVEVFDNGRGFDPEQIRSNAHGLVGMRHRVEAAGGQLTVESRLNAGTRIAALLPKKNAGA